jgi:hypothetical protein
MGDADRRKNQPLWARNEKTADARPLIMALVTNRSISATRNFCLSIPSLDGGKEWLRENHES